jgi:hypothetical protein
MNNLKEILKAEKFFFLDFFKKKKYYSFYFKKKYERETVYQRKLRISYELCRLFKNKIKYGPYKGTTFSIKENNEIKFVDYGSYLLGLYESTISEILINQKKYKLTNFVQLGASVGYHAIGLIKNRYFNTAVCFEKDEAIKNILIKNIILNKCQKKIKVFSEAKENFHLKITRPEKTMILIDIEGHEFKILNLKSIIGIKKSHLIIEIHQWANNFTIEYQKLLKILLKYFKIKFITHPEGSTEINKFKELNAFTDDNRYLICSEHRPSKMRYLYCIPKHL